MKRTTALLILALSATAALAADPAPAQPIDLKQRYAALKSNILTCPDDAYDAGVKALRDFLANPGVTNENTLVDFYLNVVRKDPPPISEPPDCFALAKAAAGKNLLARQKYCHARFSAMRLAIITRRPVLNAKYSHEARLAFAEEVLADPSLQLAGVARYEKIEALRWLGRYDDAVAFAKAEIDRSKTPAEKLGIYRNLADFYAETAKRYMAPSDPATLAKAVETLSTATAMTNAYNASRTYALDLVKLAGWEWSLGRKEAAKATLEKAVAAEKQPCFDVIYLCGKFAYNEGDYEQAVKFWAPHANRFAPDRRILFVRALYALGRREEAVPHLEYLSKSANKILRPYYAYALEEYKKSVK